MEEEKERGTQEEGQKKEGGSKYNRLISFQDSTEGKVMRTVKGTKKIEAHF